MSHRSISVSRRHGVTVLRENPASRKMYRDLAECLHFALGRAPSFRENEATFHAWAAGFDAAVVEIKGALKRDNPRFDAERFDNAVYGSKRTRLLSNPSLAVFGNPPRGSIRGIRTEAGSGTWDVLSHDVVEIRYIHSHDRKAYKHQFSRKQVKLYASPGGKDAILRRVDGKPLVEDY